MTNPREEVLRAVINLEGSPDFQVVVKWVQESYTGQLESNSRVADDVRTRWGQGRAQALDELLSTLTDARRIYGMMKK